MKKPDSSAMLGRSHERSNNSYDRPSGKRKPGECILIVCEGEETEPKYFMALRNELHLSENQVKIHKGCKGPLPLVEEAQRLVKQRKQDVANDKTVDSNFDAVWCVLDRENPNCNPTFEPAIRKIKKAKDPCYFPAVSNPAFEFWYLLHFESTTRQFANGEEIKKYLRNRWISGYDESMPVFDLLSKSAQLADVILRSEQILEHGSTPSVEFPNPSTQVHLLVEKMQSMSSVWNKNSRKTHT